MKSKNCKYYLCRSWLAAVVKIKTTHVLSGIEKITGGFTKWQENLK